MDKETAIRMARSFVEESNKGKKDKGFPMSNLNPSEVKEMGRSTGWYIHFDDETKDESVMIDPGLVIVQVTRKGEVSYMPTL